MENKKQKKTSSAKKSPPAKVKPVTAKPAPEAKANQMNKLVADLAGRGLPVSENLSNRLDWDWVESFYKFLLQFNEQGSFFSKGDTERILERHVYENLIFLDYVTSKENVSRETSIADAGSGPGLPGFFFACLKERPEVTLIDSSRRRLFLLETEFQAGFDLVTRENVNSFPIETWPRVHFRYERLEEVRHLFDVIVMRALIPLPFSIEVVCKMQRHGGKIYLSTTAGALSDPEIMRRVEELGYVSRETYVPKEIEFLGSRTFACFEKTGKPASRYPRAWKIIQQEMATWKESTQ